MRGFVKNRSKLYVKLIIIILSFSSVCGFFFESCVFGFCFDGNVMCSWIFFCCVRMFEGRLCVGGGGEFLLEILVYGMLRIGLWKRNFCVEFCLIVGDFWLVCYMRMLFEDYG